MTRNVLHVLGTAETRGTGIARIVSELASGMDPARYRIHACFLGGDGPLVRMLESAGVQASGVRWQGRPGDVMGIRRFWQHARSQRFDIVHLHSGGGTVLRLARAATHGKVVRHLHSNADESHGVGLLARPRRGADAVIAVSRALAAWAEGTEARVIYPGVSVPNAGCPAAAPPGSASGRVLGTAGRLVKVKGIAHLIQAFSSVRAEVPDARLEIAGAGPELSSLEHEVRNLGLEGSVQFLGWCPDLQPILAGWDVFVQSSLNEGLPIATLEAMAAGLPVVATSVGGVGEVVEHGETGWLVPPTDRNALASRLRALLRDPQKRRDMGAAARRRVIERFSTAGMVDRVVEVYDALIPQDASR